MFTGGVGLGKNRADQESAVGTDGGSRRISSCRQDAGYKRSVQTGCTIGSNTASGFFSGNGDQMVGCEIGMFGNYRAINERNPNRGAPLSAFHQSGQID